MAKRKYSPTPWQIKDMIYPGFKYIVDARGSHVAEVSKRHARLFAAAPEMLAALIDAENAMFHALEDHKFDSPADSAAVIDTLVIVRAAIAKATKGE